MALPLLQNSGADSNPQRRHGQGHFAADGETTSDLGTMAAQAALADAGMAANQIDAIVLATGDNEEQVARLARIAMLADGAAEQPGVLSNLLGAVAGAWALGVAPDLIRAGVKPYNPSAPLRAD